MKTKNKNITIKDREKKISFPVESFTDITEEEVKHPVKLAKILDNGLTLGEIKARIYNLCEISFNEEKQTENEKDIIKAFLLMVKDNYFSEEEKDNMISEIVDNVVISSFSDRIKAVNASSGQDEKSLYDLAKAIVYSVMRKIINVSNNETVKALRNELYNEFNYHNFKIYDNSFTVKQNKNGCYIGDSMDMIQEAVTIILEEIGKQFDRGEAVVDLEKPYTKKALKKRIRIKEEDSKNGFETVETTPIQEVFKAVRRLIDNSRCIQTDAKNGYSYLQDFIKNEEDNTEEAIYYRLPKYADLGGHIVDFNGKETVSTTVSEEAYKDFKDMEKLISDLKLTDRQKTVLNLRLRGYGDKAISTYLGISKQGVVKNRNLIAEKLFNYCDIKTFF